MFKFAVGELHGALNKAVTLLCHCRRELGARTLREFTDHTASVAFGASDGQQAIVQQLAYEPANDAAVDGQAFGNLACPSRAVVTDPLKEVEC